MKRSIMSALTGICITTGVAPATVLAATDADSRAKESAVFVMTNDADENEVWAYARTPEGTLTSSRTYRTGGRGSGGNVDPLASQGSLTLSQDHNWLFAVNAGSGTLSVFRVDGAHLELTDRTPTGGSEPNAVAQHGNLLYVLNTAGSSNVVGFSIQGGHLRRIENSLRFLSANGAGSASITFSPDGQWLSVTERTTNKVDVFHVQSNGQLSEVTSNTGVGPGTFAASFAPNGALIVSETGSGGNTAAVSSYSVGPNGTLVPVSASIPTLGAANCWNAITPDGRFVYVSNAGTSSISGFSIGANKALQSLPGTVVGMNSQGATNIDIAISADGKYLYSLDANAGQISAFAIDPAHGSLTQLGTFGQLPKAAGENGIAAN